MLFNSFAFIFLFLPITLVVFFSIGRQNHPRVAIFWLVLCSLFFYGWWDPRYVVLLLVSMLSNYTCGVMLEKGGGKNARHAILTLGITINIGLLGYFKYANFFVDQVNWAVGSNFQFKMILLPLAISFFTFQQITYLVDVYRYETKEHNFLHYCLFVTFFPQLIAGPIVRHKEMLPQFARDDVYVFNYQYLAIGLAIFTIGIFKKVIFADGMAVYANSVFNAAETASVLTFFEAWVGALAYTLQLYFDFSGYSDMAIGLAYMFGIKLPINFNSPYKSTCIIDFWRRWHITLSRFLRDYLYIPLGGNRKGSVRRSFNLLLTMLLGGLWHGAGWTFVIWGMLHGFYLLINHAWRKLRTDVFTWPEKMGRAEVGIYHMLTLLAVVIGWVYFRAETVSGAHHIILTMLGAHGISLSSGLESSLGVMALEMKKFGFVFEGMFANLRTDFGQGAKWIALLFLIIFIMPNSQQIINLNLPPQRIIVVRKPFISGLISAAALYYVFIHLSAEAEFVYMNF